VRAAGDLIARVSLENTLGPVIHDQPLSFAFDGEHESFWLSTVRVPAPIKADSKTIPWLTRSYRFGAACRLRINLERPAYISEIYIDPLAGDPMYFVGFQWRPLSLTELIVNNTFNAITNFSSSFSYPTSWSVYPPDTNQWVRPSSGTGFDGTSALMVDNRQSVAQKAYAYQKVPLSGISEDAYLTLSWYQKGTIGYRAGASILFLGASSSFSVSPVGASLSLTESWAKHEVSTYLPSGASSAYILLGIFTGDPASALFENASLTYNTTQTENPFGAQPVRLDKPRTIALKSPVLSDTFWLVFAQPNARRSLWPLNELQAQNVFLDSESNPAWAQALRMQGMDRSPPNAQVFEYTMGAKEIDLRYNEYLATGRAVTRPLKTYNEIREFWVEAQSESFGVENISYHFLLRPGDPLSSAIPAVPLTSLDSTGKITIYTPEELDSGWVSPRMLSSSASSYSSIIISPVPIRKQYAGTDRFGKLSLEFAPHLRATQVKRIQDFLEQSYPTPVSFDPNAQSVAGLDFPGISSGYTPAAWLSYILSSQRNSDGSLISVSASSMPSVIRTKGYQPLKVWIETDQWSAVPDTFGTPEAGRVRYQALEFLQASQETVTQTFTLEQEEFWVWDLQLGVRRKRRVSKAEIQSIIDSMESLDSQGQLDSTQKQQLIYYKQQLSSGRTVRTQVSPKATFQTRYHPIVSGKGADLGMSNHTLLRLWWYNALSNVVLPLSQDQFQVTDSQQGLIALFVSNPSTGSEWQLYADYWHISPQGTEEPYSWAWSLTAIPSGYAVTGAIGTFPTIARSYPLTRNKTDYISGRVPTLRPPNLNSLDEQAYYPIIEYYVSESGELVFSRDFFEFGDTPAKISVEYESLKVAPQLIVDLSREGLLSTRSPILKGLAIGAKEKSNRALQ
jgi:hypothetical protein